VKVHEFTWALGLGCWLPDSERIVFPRNMGNPSNWELYVSPYDREERQQITFTSTLDERCCSVNTENDKIAYLASPVGNPGNIDLYVEDLHIPSIYINNLSLVSEIMTPNGDGVDDYTTVTFTVNRNCLVTAKIYDYTQTLIATLAEKKNALKGSNTIIWNGLNRYGFLSADSVCDVRIDAYDPFTEESALTVSSQISVCKSKRKVPDNSVPARFASDGVRLAMTRHDYDHDLHDIVIWNIQTDEITSMGLTNVAAQTLSPDSTLSKFAYSSTANPNPILYSKEIDGNSLCQKDPYFTYVVSSQIASWNPDNTRIVYIEGRKYDSEEQKPTGLFIMDQDCGNDATLYYEPLPPYSSFNGPRASSPNWSPLGNLITFICNRESYDQLVPYYDVFTIEPNGANLTNFTQEQDLQHGAPTITPDGKAILYTSNRGRVGMQDRIWLQSTDHQIEKRLLPGANQGWSIAISPNGFIVAHGAYYMYELFNSLILGDIEGFVLLEDGKTPAVGLMIEALQGSVAKYSTVCNSYGAFKIMNVQPGDYDIVAKGPHYKESDPVSVTVESLKTATANPQVTKLPTASILSPIPNVEKNYGLIVETIADDPLTDSVKFYAKQMGGASDKGALVDDWILIGEICQSPFNFEWDLTKVTEGQYEIKPVAEKEGTLIDNAPSTTSLIVDKTPPSVQIINPVNNDTLTTSTIIVQINSSDKDIESIIVEVKLEAGEGWRRCGMAKVAPWGTTAVIEDPMFGVSYQMRAIASDKAGNDSTSEIVQFSLTPKVTAQDMIDTLLGNGDSQYKDVNGDGIVDVSDLVWLIRGK
jgi:hypothetical protein